MLSPFHGTIEIGPDGEPTKFSPGIGETKEMQIRAHEDFKAQMGPSFPNVGVDSNYADLFSERQFDDGRMYR